MKVFVLNCGSSSIKYKLFNMENESVIAVGKVERIGSEQAEINHRPMGARTFHRTEMILEHQAAIQKVLELLSEPPYGVVKEASEIGAVGHRVVHGGERFSESVRVDDQVKHSFAELNALAPLHNPHNLEGILATERLLPGTPQVAVFDTAFHASLPPYAYMYPIPYTLYERHRLRRYGFHGTSHQYVSRRAGELVGRPRKELKIISCHLGNGASVAAILGDRSIDTSMGFTPLEGLMMGTRSGDIDAGLVFYVMAREELSLAEANAMLNKHSGIYGISGIGSDMRDIETAMAAGDERSTLAFQMYEYRLRKYIGAYVAAMNGVEVIVFTGGIGQHSSLLRARLCERLTYLGVVLDPDANESPEAEKRISAPESRVHLFVIPTDEELVIARETVGIVTGGHP